MKLRKGLGGGLTGLGLALLGLAAVAGIRFVRGRQRVEREWAAARFPKLDKLGTVKQLSILPLIDWYTADEGLASEPGVSYLVRADHKTILFDLGYNQQAEHPSPLLRNMQALGVNLDDIDAIVISHAHEDHVGGNQHMQSGTFALSGERVDLKGIPAYVPVPLSNPDTQSIVTDQPRILAPGLALMGVIPRQLFFLGRTLEQSLAINVAGKGIVLVVGCGHPRLQRIVDRAEALFDAPIYGLVGGLHYPVDESREKKLGIEMQAVFGTGKWPWDPINREDVADSIAYLQRRKPGLVSLSPHDSCDWSLEAFRSAFPEAYQPLLVGREIVVA
jgi:7,8-dihydropterin-6-yl-methyl-4-(beta-D-ribofuranosyl)aminobenzene 5'-phosphate synthase